MVLVSSAPNVNRPPTQAVTEQRRAVVKWRGPDSAQDAQGLDFTLDGGEFPACLHSAHCCGFLIFKMVSVVVGFGIDGFPALSHPMKL